MKTWISIILAIIVLGGGVYWWMQQGQSPQIPTQEQTYTPPATTPTTNATSQDTTPSAAVNKSSLNQNITAYPPKSTSAEPEMGGPFGTLTLGGTAKNADSVTVMMVRVGFGGNMDYDALVKWAHDVGSDVYVSTETVSNGNWSVSFKGINEGTYSVKVYNPTNRAVLATETTKVSVK